MEPPDLQDLLAHLVRRDYPSRSNFVGPMRGNEPQKPERGSDTRQNILNEYLYQRDLRRYLKANGVEPPLSAIQGDFTSPFLRRSVDIARDRADTDSVRVNDDPLQDTWNR